MSFLADTVVWLLQLVRQVLGLYAILIFVVVLLSWVNPDPWNPIVRTLRAITDPVLDRARRVVPSFGFLDLSPWVVMLAIGFLQSVALPHLIALVARMGAQ